MDEDDLTLNDNSHRYTESSNPAVSSTSAIELPELVDSDDAAIDQNPLSFNLARQEHSDTESLSKYRISRDIDERESSTIDLNHPGSSRRHRNRSRSYRYRHLDSDRSSDSSKALDESEESVQNDDDDDDEDDDDDDDECDYRRWRHRRHRSSVGERSTSKSIQHHTVSDSPKSFFRNRPKTSNHDNRHRRSRYNKQEYRSNERITPKYPSFTHSTSSAVTLPLCPSNLYRPEGLNRALPAGVYFPAEPYNPEDAIINQSILNYVPSAINPSNINLIKPRPRRQLVNVSLVPNNRIEEFDQQTSNIENGNGNNVNIELTKSKEDQSSKDIETERSSKNQTRQQRFDFKKNHNRSSTLLIQKIPIEMNRIELLNEHFQKFGSILDIKIGGDKQDPESALIRYSSPIEATRAYRSTEPVLNNRFIKVFWANRDQVSHNKNNIQNNNSGSHHSLGRKIIVDSSLNKRKPYATQICRDQPQTTSSLSLSTKKFKPVGEQSSTPRKPLGVVITPHQRLLIQQWRQQVQNFDNQLKELFCNHRLLMKKFESKPDDPNQRQNLKKLINSNLERIEEVKQKLSNLKSPLPPTNSAINGTVANINSESVNETESVPTANQVASVVGPSNQKVTQFE